MKRIPEPMQPEQHDWRFVRELARPMPGIFHWQRRQSAIDEADLSAGVRLAFDFPDAAQSLQTAYDDLRTFFQAAAVTLSGGYEIATEYEKQNVFESFRIIVTENSCRILASDTEGIRRGIYHLEDLLLGSDGPFLKLGKITRSPWIKNRISRCFFGPIKRPPLNRDELLDDVDYYPEAYLDRLAHEGINGLWLTVAFKDLCSTSVAPEYGTDAEKRFDKLRRTVDKCLRYGIKTYIFCIEPAAWDRHSPALLRHPELGGGIAYNDKICFCPFSDASQRYLYEAVNTIFTAVPALGGMINISHGERPTTCLSSVAATDDKPVNCPVCSNKKHGEILRATLTPMEKGMRDAAPNAQLISWLYMPQPSSRADWVFTLPEYVPERVILQFNFESGGIREQLGQPRIGGDYWLSYPGPSEHFRRIAKTTNAHGVPLSAKIQVGCSHEVATVPFVPVPALLYRKYQAMRELGVSSVMQCWYFGNYPGVMNKAAGMLAFDDFKDNERDFLKRLALPEWGKHADEVVEAWTLFAAGYAHYPFSNMFQYFGPMHDGVVWPLYLYPENKPLAPTWKLEFGTSGDHIGECLENHTIDEAIILCGEMAEKWHRGVDLLKKLEHAFKDNPERLKDIGLAEALGIQFASGHAILRFYALREQLFASDCPAPAAILDDMATIVKAEIIRCQRLIELCKNDSRLGFHSEAEGYKYCPRKLAWRMQMLENLLAEDFVKARQNIADNKLELPPPESCRTYICGNNNIEHCDSFRWQAECGSQQLNFFIECLDQGEPDQLLLALSTANTRYPLFVNLDKSGKLYAANSVKADVSSNADGWRANINIPLDSISREAINTAKLNITRTVNFNEKTETHRWPISSNTPVYRLNLGLYNPQQNGVFVLNQ